MDNKAVRQVLEHDRIFALDQRGELLLLEANPQKLDLVGRRRVADDSWAHLAVAGKEIFVRDLEAMRVFSWR